MAVLRVCCTKSVIWYHSRPPMLIKRQLVLHYSEKYGGQYIGSFAEPPSATEKTVSASVERLLVASAPFQEMFVHTRRIYRWENPNETLTYLTFFLFLWKIDCLCGAAVSLYLPV